MNIYEKVLLYAYPHLEAIIESIDSSIEKKALASFTDYSPCLVQAEKIIDLIVQKDDLIDLKIILDEVLKEFSSDDIVFFEYKYFKQKPKSYFENFDFTSRAYFRKQIRLVKILKDKLEKRGITDEIFKERYLKIDFIKALTKRVEELEKLSYKNKKKPFNDTNIENKKAG